jgi:hypothetical protein
MLSAVQFAPKRFAKETGEIEGMCHGISVTANSDIIAIDLLEGKLVSRFFEDLESDGLV